MSNTLNDGGSIERGADVLSEPMPTDRSATPTSADVDAVEALSALRGDLAVLRGALGGLFKLPDLLGLSTSALSRELDVDRSTLQRLVQ